ncbi:hypothetical protein HA402_004978 [Bradysia odoriphaga]|nr:hypothetical protein HA402_004978 [Bradysia odoriphaga]
MDIPSFVRFCILVGSARFGGNTIGLSKWVYNELQSSINNATSEICLVDPHTKPHPVTPVLDNTSPAMVKDPTMYASQEVRDWSQFINSCSAMIIVTPEYNGGYPSTLKNALDVLFWEWQNKPAAVVTAGGGGGRKCDEQLRQVMSALQMDVVEQRVQVQLPKSYTYTNQRIIPSEQHDTFLVQYRDTLRFAFGQLIDKISKTSRQ